ncbi:MAG: helix-turn-helix transcriptional regulator [Eubacterium sp.]|nr:helix-turn-helix transcriptional regulator [Eubacterium sp.]
MEFHEKLQELRKARGLTQEELAEALFVSRTAVSKWESGRGYPNIDSLKSLAEFFSVTVDEMLSGEKIISIAEKENRSNIRNLCGILMGITDLFTFMLIILPLYPKTIDGHILSVNLFSYSELAPAIRQTYWLLFVLLIAIGLIKILLIKLKTEKAGGFINGISIGISVLTVVLLAITREAYAVVMIFLLLLVKMTLIYIAND